MNMPSDQDRELALEVARRLAHAGRALSYNEEVKIADALLRAGLEGEARGLRKAVEMVDGLRKALGMNMSAAQAQEFIEKRAAEIEEQLKK